MIGDLLIMAANRLRLQEVAQAIGVRRNMSTRERGPV